MSTMMQHAGHGLGLGLGLGPDRWPRPLRDDLAYIRTGIVNLYLVGPEGAGDRGWVLVDAGLIGSIGAIERAAARRFGEGARPSAIVLTHGHFDHVGALEGLADRWDVPVFAHAMELPYITGRSSYPPPDPTVGGGLMASLSWLYPAGPVDVGGRARPLPKDGGIPGMEGWRWLPTPGHSPGHVSLFRDSDRTLIAGDAFITTRQESAVAVATQAPEIHGPPMYFTPDWPTAWHSVRSLAALEPDLAATGHGEPMSGEPLRSGLHRLARRFAELAMPEHGRYVGRSAMADDRGVTYVPPDVPHPTARLLAGVGLGLLAGVAIGSLMVGDD
jgi:glyoxylase-like metal-dependent hydrolase (beta-lactamase superfamily II)